MNPLFASFFGALFHITRTCPKCGKEQTVATGKSDKTILCRFCRAEIPPRKESKR